MNINKIKGILLLALMLLIQVSCTESQQMISATAYQPEQSDGSKIVFVNLSFLKTNDGKDSCDIINAVVADGTLRETLSHQLRNKENYYTLFFNSCDGKTIYKAEIENQLDTQMEVYNESGAIELKDISFKRREYSIRMQKGKEKICRLIVTKTTKGQTQTICNHLIILK